MAVATSADSAAASRVVSHSSLRAAFLYFCLVGEICGSPITLQWAPEARLAQPANRCGIARLQLFPVCSQLPSNQFALSGKRNVVNSGLAFKSVNHTSALSRSARCAFFGQLTKPLKSQRAPICPWYVC